LPESIEFAALVDVAKLRWRIERDYQELKQEVGSDIPKAADGAASTTTYGFSVSKRETIPPQDLVPPGCSKNLPFMPVADPAAPPLRTERHIRYLGHSEQ
jgi:hypothetical protein